MGTVASGVSGTVAGVFLLAENRLLREALLRILSKKDDIRVLGSGSYGPGTLEQILSTRASVVVLDSVTPVLAERGVVRELHRLNPAIRVVMVGMEAEEAVFLRAVQAGVVGTHYSSRRHRRSSLPGDALCRAVSVGGAASASRSELASQDQSGAKPQRAGIGGVDSAGAHE
jgi:DNA-binding NarL/FixJ family response regulator